MEKNFNYRSEHNDTQDLGDNDRVQLTVYVLRIIFVIFYSIFTICGNFLCIRVLQHTPELHEGTKVLMMSLAVADLSVGFIGALSIVPAILDRWPYGQVICKMSCTFSISFCVCSVMSLCLLTIDRCLAVTKPLHHVTLVSKTRALIVIVIMWILSFVIITLCSIDTKVEYDKTSALCIALMEDEKYLIKVTMLVVFLYFIPMLVMVCTYSKLLCISRQHVKQIGAMDAFQTMSPRCSVDNSVSFSNEQLPTVTDDQAMNITHLSSLSAPGRHGRRPPLIGRSSLSDRLSLSGRASLSSITNRCRRSMREWKALLMFCTVTIVFTITWMPYVCTTLINTIRMQRPPEWLEFLVQWLALCNSWCNVCIYLFINVSFRKTAIRLIKSGQTTACMCCYKCCLRSNDE
ncbi:trace amine-associated receptor 8b-like [Amphiura filiformis]|uniref:trace amine-associated receptor 8b-like n=1 Tax=Amphiura filiformis TaxID=82378 RepID=UPI003B21186C